MSQKNVSTVYIVKYKEGKCCSGTPGSISSSKVDHFIELFMLIFCQKMVKLKLKVKDELKNLLDNTIMLEKQVHDNLAALKDATDKVTDVNDKRCKIVEAELKQIIVETGKLRQTAVANKMAVGKVQGVHN